MKKPLTAALAVLFLLSGGLAAADDHSMSEDAVTCSGCTVIVTAESASGKLDAISGHMVAQALLTAHFIDAALAAGMEPARIDAALAAIAERSIITEFWISDETGRIEFTNAPGSGFSFPTDPNAGTQAAPFAVLLGATSPGAGVAAVVQDAQPRDLDAAIFKYVAVAGVDRPRIVQVGVSADELESAERRGTVR